jgi:hypothetical protein
MARFLVACGWQTVGVLAIGIVAAFGNSRTFAANAAAAAAVRAIWDSASGQIDVVEGDRPVLRYNYQTVQPPDGFLGCVQPANRKYGRPRSDYIHPLFDLDGETLTADWSKDHPHHRGIYWAWPEVDYRGQRGDLHALQNVFARPTGRLNLRNTADYAEIEAENVWKWEDKTPIVLETATIRVRRSGEHSRFVDLTLKFHAIADDVALARRGTEHYGGLNLRLAPIRNLNFSTHTDAADATPRASWGEARGIWGQGDRTAALAVFQHPGNPQYPAQWIEYPYLPWFQPTFPTTATRYILKKGQPLELKYRLWIRRGDKLSDETYRQQWQAYQQASGS